MDRLLSYYEHKLVYFQDIYYDGKIIETKEQLKNSFLNNKINMPMTKRLKRMENIILHKVHPMRRKRLSKIEKIVKNSYGHEFEEKSFSRLLAIKEAKTFMVKLRSFTEVSYFQIYKSLFSKKSLFFKLAKELKLPENIEDMIAQTIDNLNKGFISFEDSAPLLYIKLKVEGSEEFKEMKQVVIDEAQDYYPIHYKVFSILFRAARFTVLGDINQSIEKGRYDDIYDEIENILNKKKSLKLFLKKGYRSSFEINLFAQKLLNSNDALNAFERHEEKPKIIVKNSLEEINEEIKITAENYHKQGYKSIAVVCKTESEKYKVYESLKEIMDIELLDENNREVKSGAVLVSSYMAKGLEFDAVIVYNADSSVYSTELDRKLLYIACTRPLHKLIIYSTGENDMLL